GQVPAHRALPMPAPHANRAPGPAGIARRGSPLLGREGQRPAPLEEYTLFSLDSTTSGRNVRNAAPMVATPTSAPSRRASADACARFAWAVLAYDVAVAAWGSYVRATGSGAGCGSHWPLCNGELVPHTEAWRRTSMLIEYSHRATSGLALLLTFALLAWI